MHQLAEKWPPLSFFREGKIRLPASAGRSSVLDEWKRLVLTMDSGIRRNWSVAFACAKKWRSLSHNGENDHLLKLPVLGEIADCALTDERRIAFEASGLPNTFVPGRNLLFFTLAASLAYRRGLRVLVGGMCETDYSGYPACRDNTLKSLQVTLDLGLDMPFIIETPLMRLSKAETWALAEHVGGDPFVELVRNETHTCYMGDHQHRHVWGYGCGECPACKLRAQGWASWSEHARFADASTAV